jgi:hypothetical protein
MSTIDDAKKNAALAARARKAGIPEWQKEMSEAVGTNLIGDIVSDSRRGHAPRSAISPPSQGAAPAIGKHGWVDPPKVDDWRPPGLDVIDRMMDQQDAADRADLVKKLKR